VTSATLSRAGGLTSVRRGDWLTLPSGRTVQVCRIDGVLHPEVSLRYLDDDGVMATGDFIVKLSWLLTNARRV
jgi:hypothetical protein